MSTYDEIKKMFKREVYCCCPAIEELLNLSPDLLWEVENLEEKNGRLKEVINWYRVSEFLYDDLREKGYPVLEFCNAYYWGRETFGQSIYLDGIFEELYKERIKKCPWLA